MRWEAQPFLMFKFLPWRYFVKHAARHYGVLDPTTILARLRAFAQPSEVGEPMELLRAGIIFHARGLVNSKSIQHNLDWVWPYWVERQFNPDDPSFIPRAFSFSHINLTHRNWTAVGHPDTPAYPIIDPRGLVTPLHDGWSLDFWLITDSRKRLLPSKLDDTQVRQELTFNPELTVTTHSADNGMWLDVAVSMTEARELLMEVEANADEDGWLAVALRPYNPEGVQFIEKIQKLSPREFRINGEATVRFDRDSDSTRMAHYAEGDVYLDLATASDKSRQEITCDAGMATAAALFRIKAGSAFKVGVTTTLERDIKARTTPAESWGQAVGKMSQLKIADGKMQFLHDAALRTVLLLSADELVPGPYTYRRFWFRDACLMLHPLIVIGGVERAERIIGRFAERQTMGGYFQSQEGEWDSNGQVLWILARYAELTGRDLDARTLASVKKGVTWLDRKRLGDKGPAGTRGLLPAGFSAEHLGPNDYYYWDDFWAWAGLESIAAYWRKRGATEDADKATALAAEFARDIRKSIAEVPERRAKGGIPAAPGRRMDAGAIGSMVADYPLQLYPPGEPKIMRTADFLMTECFNGGGFLQQMIHSGINAYLTLDLAQTLLRAGDPRFMDLIRAVARLASPTGQWPEAIHPRTLGGCMGDGQHGWAAAEWLMMIRNCFIREESNCLIIGSGILPEWRDEGEEISYGPTLTTWGRVSVKLTGQHLVLHTEWRQPPPRMRILVPGFNPIEADPSVDEYNLLKP